MSIVSPEQIEQYHREGFFVLESIIPENVLNDLRAECMRFIADFDRQMEAKGVQQDGINHYKKRYFVGNRSSESSIMQNFLYSDLMADVTTSVLGDSVYLFVEQYVVKAADSNNKFNWHQDSGYVGHAHTPYLSCWCALDDMSVENGTIFVLPYSRDGRKTGDELIDHKLDKNTNDKVGYHGDDPGDPVIVPAGSIVAFSSRTFHRSGANSTDQYRRSYLCQYSPEPIMNKDGSALWRRAEPFVIDGIRIAGKNKKPE